MSRSARLVVLAGLSLAGLGSLLGGCGQAYKLNYHESGSGASIDQYTWVSRPFEPKTVMLVDLRTDEVYWSVDIPVGQQLTVRFYENEEPENEFTPALMRWEIQEAGTKFRKLANAQLVPPVTVRRIDWEFRAAPEARGG